MIRYEATWTRARRLREVLETLPARDVRPPA